jgi:hypothetical protein
VPIGYANSYRDTENNPDSDANSQSHRDTYTDGNSNCNTNSNSNSDCDANSKPIWEHMPPATDDQPYQGS